MTKTENASPELIIRMQGRMRQMPPAMQKVADYIIRNFSAVDGMQLQQMAALCGASTATITRFVRYMGFAGFQDFSLEVARECSGTVPDDRGYKRISENSSKEEIIGQVFSSNIAILQDTAKIIDQEAVDEACRLLAECRKVLIFAQGRSRIAAESMKQRFRRLGIACEVLSDPHAAIMECMTLRGDEVAVGISAHGRSREVILGMKEAKEMKVPVIGITSVSGAPIEEWADVILLTANNEMMQVGLEPSGTAVAQMALIDCIYVFLYRMRRKELDELADKTSEAMKREMI